MDVFQLFAVSNARRRPVVKHQNKFRDIASYITMATFFPGGIFSVSSISSSTMAVREERLKTAKTHADKTQRELARDRMNLERKEKQLVSDLTFIYLKQKHFN